MLNFWHNLPLTINPIAFTVGTFSIRWYSLGYLLALLTVYLILKNRIATKKIPTKLVNKLNLENLETIILFIFLGAIIGGKIGYLLFYDFNNLISNPLATISPFENNHFVGFYGMSFHGGLIGAILSGWLVSKKLHLHFYSLLNFIIPVFPLGYFWGRIGNFMNKELFGRITHSEIGMYFSKSDAHLKILRHPSQLYEAFGEGLLLFFILKYFSTKKEWANKLFPLFLIFYGLIRFIIEFFRQPDYQLGFIAFNWLTMGQLLCFTMIIIGLIILKYSPKNNF